MNCAARILVVEDMQSFRALIRSYLEDAGYRVTCVAGGIEALVALEQERFDLVLSDLVMIGMDGMALLNQVRRRHPQLPFVLVTAHGSIDNAVAAMKNGADDYLQKPFRHRELVTVVERLLEHARLKILYGLMSSDGRERGGVLGGPGSATKSGVPSAAQPTKAWPGGEGAVPGVGANAAPGVIANSAVPLRPAALPAPLPENELFYGAPGVFIAPDGKAGPPRGGAPDLAVPQDCDGVLSPEPVPPRSLEDAAPENPFGLSGHGSGTAWGSRRPAPVEGEYPVLARSLTDILPVLRVPREDQPPAEKFLNRFRQNQSQPEPGTGDPNFRTRA
jgi:two-component system, NtrC family, response regulator AtoC